MRSKKTSCDVVSLLCSSFHLSGIFIIFSGNKEQMEMTCCLCTTSRHFLGLQTYNDFYITHNFP